MVPKLEYQPWYGAECITPRELREQWIDLHLRPECQQLRSNIISIILILSDLRFNFLL